MSLTFKTIVLTGGFSGFLSSIVLAIVTQLKLKEQFYLVGFLTSLSLNNFSHFSVELELFKTFSFIPFFPISLTLTIPICGYLYISHTLTPKNNESNIKEKLLISLIGIEVLFYLTIFTAFRIKEAIIVDNEFLLQKLSQLKELMSIFLSIILIIDVILLLNKRPKRTQNAEKKYSLWGKFFFALCFLVVIPWIASYIYSFFQESFSREIYHPIWYFSSVVICLVSGYSLQKELRNRPIDQHKTPVDKSPALVVKEQLSKLNQAMKDHQLYKNPKLTINDFAAHCGISVYKITATLKENDLNFNSFLNCHRVEEAKKLLLEKDFFKYNLDAIGEYAGFNSRSTFFAIFKKLTGSTPKQFREAGGANPLPSGYPQNSPENSKSV